MKNVLIGAVIALSLAQVGAVAAQDYVDPIPRQYDGLKLDTRTDAAALAVPDDVQLVQILRLYNTTTRDRFSSHEFPQNWEDLGWINEGAMGLISFVPFSGSHPLYNCFTGNTPGDKVPDHFTSTDPNCEGQLKSTYQPIIGYVANTQLPGTTPLYRCDYPRFDDHFDSVDPTCEGWDKVGAINEYVLGYIWY